MGFLSLRGGGWDKKGGLCSDLSGHERKTGRLQVWRSNKYFAQYPWVLRWSLEKKRVNLCIARGPFGALTSVKIVVVVFRLVPSIPDNRGSTVLVFGGCVGTAY